VRAGSVTKEGPPLVRSYLVQAVQRYSQPPRPCQDLYLRAREYSPSPIGCILQPLAVGQLQQVLGPAGP